MIQVSGVTKAYGPRYAVRDLSFEVQKGEIVGFLGPNGAGKTTTMKILTAFMPATSGTARVAGYDVFTHSHDVKKNVGYLPETPPVYPEMKVQDYIEFAAKIHDVPRNALRKSIDHAIEKTGLEQVRKRLIGNLSKGYRQRVGIAQALVHEPQVLILDEPTVGLDPAQIIEIRELIRSLGSQHTVILSTHILPEVTATCGRIIVINQGQIVTQDTIVNLTNQNKFSLKVRKPTKKGIDAIKKVAGVQTVTDTKDRLIVETDAQGVENRDQISKAAVENGMGLLEFSSGRLDLEEVFLKLITTDSAVSGKN